MNTEIKQTRSSFVDVTVCIVTFLSVARLLPPTVFQLPRRRKKEIVSEIPQIILATAAAVFHVAGGGSLSSSIR